MKHSILFVTLLPCSWDGFTNALESYYDPRSLRVRGAKRELERTLAKGDDFEKDKKCPKKEKDGKLFEKKNVKDAEKCRKECEKNDDCMFYSFGTDNSKQPGNCMGCSSDKNAEKDKGYNLYEMDTPKDDDFEKDKRCPKKEKDGLLFEVFSVENERKCQRLCKKVNGCEFFSFGTKDSSTPGNCMGCDSDKKAKKDKGFNLYKYENKEDFQKDKMCPTKKNKGLLFEKKNVKNAGKCQQECKKDKECKYYSFGTEDSSSPGNCMGCTSDKNAKDKKGFNLYAI